MPSFNRSRPAPEDLLLKNGNGSSTATATADEAIARIYAVYRDELHTHARRLLGSHDLADDAVQQAFSNTIVAVRRGASIDHAARWLHTSVRNACVDYLREQKMLSLREAEEVPASSLPMDVIDAKERAAKISHAVRQLPDHLRAAFVLTDVHGFSYQEVATHMHKSVASVRQLIFRARRHVREMTEGGGLALGLPALMLRAVVEGRDHLQTLRAAVAARLDTVQIWLASLGERLLGGVAQAAVPVGGALLVTAAVAVHQGAERPARVGVHAIPAIFDARERLVGSHVTQASDSRRVPRAPAPSGGSTRYGAGARVPQPHGGAGESGAAGSSPVREGKQLSRTSDDRRGGSSGAGLVGNGGGGAWSSSPPMPAPPKEGYRPPDPKPQVDRTTPELSKGPQGGDSPPGEPEPQGPQAEEENRGPGGGDRPRPVPNSLPVLPQRS